MVGEASAIELLKKWLNIEQSILKQKSRLKWLNEGDSSSSYFHASLEDRSSQNKIYKLVSVDRCECFTNEEIEEEIL